MTESKTAQQLNTAELLSTDTCQAARGGKELWRDVISF